MTVWFVRRVSGVAYITAIGVRFPRFYLLYSFFLELGGWFSMDLYFVFLYSNLVVNLGGFAWIFISGDRFGWCLFVLARVFGSPLFLLTLGMQKLLYYFFLLSCSMSIMIYLFLKHFLIEPVWEKTKLLLGYGSLPKWKLKPLKLEWSVLLSKFLTE